MYRINIRGFRYAVVERDVRGFAQYKAIKEIPGAMTIGITPTAAKGDMFGDGVKRASVQKLTGYDLAVELNKIPLTDRAVWQGNNFGEKGVMQVKGTDMSPYIAIGFIIDLVDGGMEAIWFPKCSVSPISNNLQQTTDNANFSQDTISLKAVFRASDGGVMFMIDTSDEKCEYTPEDAEDFLKAVPGGTHAVTGPPEGTEE
jgi:phi13 family phage major tail protein